jgi:predicted nucleic acid-binding protein
MAEQEVVIVADASPLIALATIDRLALLPALFGSVKVVQSVCKEVMTGAFDPTERRIAQAFENTWLERVADMAPDFEPMPALAKADWVHLDPGEAASISFAMQAPEKHSVLIDELAGRKVCQLLGLQYTGTAALIAQAKQRGLIPSAKAELARLHAAGFWISAHVIRSVLARVGE